MVRRRSKKGCSKTADLKKRETAAEANLKEKAQTDQALYLTMQLGQQTALYGGQAGNSFKQAQGGRGYGYQQQQQQQVWQGQQQQQGWQAQQQQQQQQQVGAPQGGAIQRPMPPGPPPYNAFQGLGQPKGGGKGKGKMAGTYSTPSRFNFGKADDVLGQSVQRT